MNKGISLGLLLIASWFDGACYAQTRGHDLAADLMSHLGLNDHKNLLEAGDVIHSALLGEDELPEEVAAVGAMLLVRGVEPETVIEAFLHEETFRTVHDVGRHGALPNSDEVANAFEELTLDAEFDLARLVIDPIRDHNLSRSEAGLFRGIDNADTAAALSAWHKILEGRLTSFLEGGIAEIPIYARSRGRETSPALELSSALQATAYLEDEYPGFIDALTEPSSDLAAEFDQEYLWLETSFDGQRVWALSVDQRSTRDDSALGADLHFYASGGYNSMLTFIGAVPYGDHALVFAVNHTFTDQVVGFAAKLRKRMGRTQVAETLAEHLAEVRRQIE